MILVICSINCGSSYFSLFKKNLDGLGCRSSDVPMEKLAGADLSPFSGIIISGGPTLLSHVNQKEFLAPFQFIKEASVPILGVCLGHQIIGLLYGSQISYGDQIKRMEAIEFGKDDALFSGIKTGSLFQEAHYEYITLPDGFTLLAKSRSCANEAMKHRQKSLYGVQFHPEASGANGIAILKNFASLCREI